jgi:hypothetical protein
LVVLTDGGNASLDEIESAIDTTNGIVHFLGAVDGDDHVVEESCDLCCPFHQQKPCSEKSEMDLQFAEEAAECGKVVME